MPLTDILITSAWSLEATAGGGASTCGVGASEIVSGCLGGSGVGFWRLGSGGRIGVAVGAAAGGGDEDLAPSDRTGAAVDSFGAADFGVATAGAFLTGLGVLSGVGDNTAG